MPLGDQAIELFRQLGMVGRHATHGTLTGCRTRKSRCVPGPIVDRARTRRLKSLTHVDVAVGAVRLAFAAEMKVRPLRVAYRPTAVIRQKRFDRLELTGRRFWPPARQQHWCGLFWIHDRASLGNVRIEGVVREVEEPR